MKSYISEFESKDKPKDYYQKLLEELKGKNRELHVFNNLNEDLRDGFPFSVKDNICVRGVESTASSKILKTYKPPFNATVVERLQRQGFAFLGKTNMDEFGFGSFGINCETPARNPFNVDYVAGGSSSGAAVATSILKYHVAVAESTGGSISAPAAFCGVVGFTPTYGVVSRNGLIDYANSLDKIGFMARSAADIRKVLNMSVGRDEKDTTSLDARLRDEPKIQFSVINQLMNGLDDKVRSAFDKLLEKLKSMDYKINYVDLKDIEAAIPAYYIISTAEASTNLARYTGFKYGFKVGDFSKRYNDFFTEARMQFGSEAKRRIILGTFVRGASVKNRYYVKALKVRAMLGEKMRRILRESLIISPTMSITTPKISEVEKLSPVQTYALDMLTIPPNLCGFPHVSFPYEYIDDMPIGAQIVGDHFNDYAPISFVENWEGKFKYRFKYNIGAI